MRCSRCGLEKLVSMQDLIFALMVDYGGARTTYDFRRCYCHPDSPEPAYWKGNDITEEEAESMGALALATWRLHHGPKMGDCRELDYAYFVNGDRVIVNAIGEYFDITDEVKEGMKP